MDTALKHRKPKISDTDADSDSIDTTPTIYDEETSDFTLLIPGLPNDLAQLCLHSLHSCLLSAVCHPWRRLIYSPSFPPFFSLYALLCPASSNSLQFCSFDPISAMWRPLPAPPPIRLLHRHPSFISRALPIQSLAVSGRHLVLLAGSDRHLRPAISQPQVFDPLSGSGRWSLGPPLAAPRRWCAAGAAGSAIYVASGFGSHYDGDVARSMEKWDINNEEGEWKWQKMAALKGSSFSREAVEAVEYKGKLYMVNVKGGSVKQGGAYDVSADQWEDMPEGMLAGWKGPAAAAMDGGSGEMYMVDETKGRLSRYDDEGDEWEVMVDSPELLRGARQVAAGRGRACVVCSCVGRILVVDVTKRLPRTWVVDPPPDMEVVAVHILPRISLPE